MKGFIFVLIIFLSLLPGCHVYHNKKDITPTFSKKFIMEKLSKKDRMKLAKLINSL